MRLAEKNVYTEEQFIEWCRDGDIRSKIKKKFKFKDFIFNYLNVKPCLGGIFMNSERNAGTLYGTNYEKNKSRSVLLFI